MAVVQHCSDQRDKLRSVIDETVGGAKYVLKDTESAPDWHHSGMMYQSISQYCLFGVKIVLVFSFLCLNWGVAERYGWELSTVVPRKSGPPVSPNIRVLNTVVSGYLGCLHSKNSGNYQHHQKGSGPSLRFKMYGSEFEALDEPCVLSGSTFDSAELRSELHFWSFSSIFFRLTL